MPQDLSPPTAENAAVPGAQATGPSTPDALREVSRLAYLQAMGVDTYLSRSQLAGAAPTRRLVLVPRAPSPATEVVQQPSNRGEAPRKGNTAESVAATAAGLLGDALKPGSAPAKAADNAQTDTAARPQAHAVERFSVITLQMAGWLWLEETPPGDPGDARPNG